MLGRILGFDPSLPYADRLSSLDRAGIALWDVIGSCEREGSLDLNIRAERPNPLAGYLDERTRIERLALNGGKAAASFQAQLLPELIVRGEPRLGSLAAPLLAIGETARWRRPSAPGRDILVARLPSSSPVPTKSYRRASDKLPAWSAFIANTAC